MYIVVVSPPTEITTGKPAYFFSDNITILFGLKLTFTGWIRQLLLVGYGPSKTFMDISQVDPNAAQILTEFLENRDKENVN